jgi:hypothetical protein
LTDLPVGKISASTLNLSIAVLMQSVPARCVYSLSIERRAPDAAAFEANTVDIAADAPCCMAAVDGGVGGGVLSRCSGGALLLLCSGGSLLR